MKWNTFWSFLYCLAVVYSCCCATSLNCYLDSLCLCPTVVSLDSHKKLLITRWTPDLSSLLPASKIKHWQKKKFAHKSIPLLVCGKTMCNKSEDCCTFLFAIYIFCVKCLVETNRFTGMKQETNSMETVAHNDDPRACIYCGMDLCRFFFLMLMHLSKMAN